MTYRLMILLITLLVIVSCSSKPNSSKIDLSLLDLSVSRVEQKTQLMIAAETGDSTQLRVALERGELLNSESPEGTAFSLALKNQHHGIARILLAAGSDWTLGFGEDNSTALIYAASYAYDTLAKTLILRGAELDHIDKAGYSALARAALKGHLTTVKILINAGAEVDYLTQGRSILMHLVEDNNMLITQLFIAAGADVNFTDKSGDTALRIARRKGYFDLDLMLVQSGAGL